MMKKTFINTAIIVFFSIVSISSYAQTRVMLQHNGSATAFSGYNAFSDANTAAVNGDTIYIPGGFFGSTTINKKLVIIGTGHYPDSLKASGLSKITSTLTLTTGSDSTTIEGLYIDGDITFTTDAAIKDVVIRRNAFNGLNINGSSKNNLRVLINQNIIKGPVYLGNTDAAIFNNNIFHHYFYNVNNSLIEHNTIITSTGNWVNLLNSVSNSVFKNNIFKLSFGAYYSSFLSGENNVFENNISSYDFTGIANNIYTNNLIVNYDSIFVKDSTPHSINYASNYHIRPVLYATAQTYSTDGTEVGIYGGSAQFAYKEAAVPSNPHIISKEIDETTSANGKLRVKIKVSAQNK